MRASVPSGISHPGPLPLGSGKARVVTASLPAAISRELEPGAGGEDGGTAGAFDTGGNAEALAAGPSSLTPRLMRSFRTLASIAATPHLIYLFLLSSVTVLFRTTSI